MKIVSHLIISLLIVLNFSLMSSAQALTLNFDDVTNTSSDINFEDLTYNKYYGGFDWGDIWGIQNVTAKSSFLPTAVSGDYVAFNSMGSNATITSLSGYFNFIDTTLTLVYDSSYNLQVEGYRGSNLVYSKPVALSHTPSATEFNFNNIDKLIFKTNSTGSGVSEGIYFAMDNFKYSIPAATPEPSSIILGFLSISGIFALRRKNS